MDAIVKRGEELAYSDNDIKRLLDNDVKIWKYPDLVKCKSLSDVVSPSGGVACILYLTKANFGHWTAVIRDPGDQKGVYEVFDPYGIMPDDEVKYIDEKFANKTGQDRLYLSHIIANDLKESAARRASGKEPGFIGVKEVVYNKYKLQEYMEHVNTCGRWCGIRCLFKRFSLQGFLTLFADQTLSPDMIVTYLTIVNK